MRYVRQLGLGATLLSLTGCLDAQLSWVSSATQEESSGDTVGPAPLIAITTPSEGQFFNSSYSFAAFAIGGTCLEEGATITLSSTIVALHGQTTTCSAGVWSIAQSLGGWPEGTDTVAATMNTAVASVTITRDTVVSPASVIAPPPSNVVWSGNLSAAPFDLNCPETGTINYTFTVAGPGTGTVSQTFACTSAGIQSTTLDLTGMAGDGQTLSMAIGFTDAAGNVAGAGAWIGTLDTTGPAAPAFTGMGNMAYYAGGNDRYTTSGSVLIGGTAAAGTNIDLFTDAGCSAVQSSGTDATFSAPGISLTMTANTVHTVYAQARDFWGNPSACTFMTNAIHDSTPPVVAALATNDGVATGTTTIAPAASWGAATDSSSGLNRYEIAVGTTPGAADLSAWFGIGLVTSHPRSGLTLTNGSTYYTSVRAVDNAGNVSAAVSGDGFLCVLPPSTPTLTVAPETHTSLTLHWTNVAGETHYEIERDTSVAFLSATPFTSPADSTSTTSSGLTFRTFYYYRIRAVNAGGASAWSTTASARPLLNLQVPIEMVDVGLKSSFSPITFERTRTTISPAEYDGQVSYAFEVVATNSHSSLPYSVELVNGGGATVPGGTIPIPPNTTQQTRFRSSVTISAMDQYRIRLPNTAANNLDVSAARVIVSQIGANRTRLFIPLSIARGSAVVADGGTGNSVENNINTLYSLGGIGDAGTTVFRKNPGDYPNLAAGNPWVLEAVLGLCSGTGTAYAALTQLGGSPVVAGAEVFTGSGVPVLVNTSFPDNAGNFWAATEFEMRTRSSSGLGTACLYKANLWVRLEDIQTVWVPHRGGRNRSGISANANNALDGSRQIIETSLFSQPLAQFEVTGRSESGPTPGSADLVECGSNDADPTTCTSPISGSTFVFPNAMWGQTRSADLSLTDGARWSPRYFNTVGSTSSFRGSLLWIRASGL